MCGIFGLIKINSKIVNNSVYKDCLKTVGIASQTRGKDSSGLSFINKNEIQIFKGPTSINKLINYSEVQSEVNNVYYNVKEENSYSGAFGHARLVTNGSQLNQENNQPVVSGNITGVHNGIVANVDDVWLKHQEVNRNYDLDSEVIFSLINHKIFNDKKSIQLSVSETMDDIDGTAAIAFYLNGSNQFVLASNNGSLYQIYKKNEFLIFASEFNILNSLYKKSRFAKLLNGLIIEPINSNEGFIFNLNNGKASNFIFSLERKNSNILKNNQIKKKLKINEININNKQLSAVIDLNSIHINTNYDKEVALLKYPIDKIKQLKRCTKCILPETFPFITFDSYGICNFCINDFQKKNLKSKEELLEIIEPYKNQNLKPNVLIPLSGGRDSIYTLHFVKEELGLNPITFTYDWGMVTDLARRNIARACGKLGIENIIVAADLHKKRSNIKKNILAWLKNPDLGMIPLFMAGDKYFFYYANRVKKQLEIDLEIWGVNKLENTDFKTGFAGISPNFEKKRIYSLSIMNQMKLFSFVGKNFIKSPSYINSSVLDTLGSFFSRYFVSKKNYIQLFDYISWDEKLVEDTIINNYNWEKAYDTDSTWRIGDGTASFYNYIYTLTSGFSENDTFRSNQIRLGKIERNVALDLVYKENRPRYNSLKWYLEIIGLDYCEIINRVNGIPKHQKLD